MPFDQRAPEILGGPFDGLAVPLWWQRDVICAYTFKDAETLAVYYRQPNGDYLFQKTVHESDLEQYSGGKPCR